MSTTGDKIAGTGTSVARGTNTAWTNPGNITANDGAVASCNSGTTGSAYLRASNFTFNIPANSLIQGFTVKVDMAESSTGSETVSVQIVGAAGTAIGAAKTFIANGTALIVYTTGSSTDLWGTTGLTATDVNDTDFGVYVWYTTTHNTTVDYISIDLNYAPPISGSLSATEAGNDTFASTGTVSSAAITGSMAASETGADTFNANGNIVVSGSLSASEVGSDTFSSNGNVLVSGALSATETGNDTFSSTGKIIVSGAFSASETGNDTFSSSGTVLVQGSLSATETGLDTFSATGTINSNAVTGALVASEVGDDQFSATGLVLVYGSLTANESGDDVFSADGTVISQTTSGITGGGIRRSKILEAAQWILDLLDKDTVKQTEQVKKVKARLKKVKKPEDLEDLQPIVNTAIVEIQKQKKLADDIAQLNFVINELKIIKNQLDDEEEALLMLIA
jgi:hypothetical protein